MGGEALGQETPHLHRVMSPLIRRVGRDHISCQIPPARFLQRHHRRITNSRGGSQHRFDFCKLDSKAADLHLIVGAPEVVQFAIVAPADQIAAAIHAASR